MTPQEQAAAVLAACIPNSNSPNPTKLTAILGATAIRAAVELVLPEESEPDWGAWLGHEIEIFSEHKRLRAELLAIADAMEAPTDA